MESIIYLGIGLFNHLEMAAGLRGLVKTLVLTVKHLQWKMSEV